jgi:prepilin-type N-terminal cleavage/methylation domain-containing protein
VTSPERATSGGAGFTLLEVLVALAIVGVAVAGVLQLSSQSLRLLKLTAEHVTATGLADRLTREATYQVEGIDRGDEGPFTWERRVSLIETPPELERAGAQNAQLFAVSVLVRWNPNRTVEVATMRTAVPSALASTEPGRAGPPGGRVTPEPLPGQDRSRGLGRPGTSTPGAGLGSSLGSGRTTSPGTRSGRSGPTTPSGGLGTR